MTIYNDQISELIIKLKEGSIKICINNANLSINNRLIVHDCCTLSE